MKPPVDQTVQNDGFLALAAPHTGIIPALATILASLRVGVTNKGDVSADLGWFLVPVMAIPFDVLALTQSVVEKHSRYTVGFFSFGLCISTFTAAFTTISAFVVRSQKGENLVDDTNSGIKLLNRFVGGEELGARD